MAKNLVLIAVFRYLAIFFFACGEFLSFLGVDDCYRCLRGVTQTKEGKRARYPLEAQVVDVWQHRAGILDHHFKFGMMALQKPNIGMETRMELSTVVQQYQQVTRDTSTAIEQRAEKNASRLTALLSPYLMTGETMPEVKTLLLLLARLPQHHQQNLEGADQRHAQELGDDAAALQARDDAARAVYDELVQIRSEVEAAFGVGGVTALGMSGLTPKQPALLERYANDVIDRLKKNVNLGTPLRKRSTFDSAAAVDDLLPLCEMLRGALNTVAKEIAEAKETQDAKNEAFAQWESNVPPAILAAKALFVLSGDQEGAARLYVTPASYRKRDA